MAITRKGLEELGANSGFQATNLEKVVKLLNILEGLTRHELTKAKWVLKGGSALNLLHLELPRLSVDIDINFIGGETLEELKDKRETFERAVIQVCREALCSVRRVPTEHAGGKLRLQYQSVFGGEKNLEVDLNYVQRVPLFGVKEKAVKVLAEWVSESLRVPTLSLEELAAGKFAALVSRSAPRDLFDAKNLLDLRHDLMRDDNFRIAFLCTILSARKDFLFSKPISLQVIKAHVKDQLLPLLRVSPGGEPVSVEYLISMGAEVETELRELYRLSANEEKFVNEFYEQGKIEPGFLTENVPLQKRILKQPMLLWKQKHIKEKLKE